MQLKTRPACPEGGLAQKRTSGALVCLLLSDLLKLPAGETQALSCNKYTKSVDHNFLFLYGLKDKALQHISEIELKGKTLFLIYHYDYYYLYLTQHDHIYWPKDCFYYQYVFIYNFPSFLINNDQLIYNVSFLHFKAIHGINTLCVLVAIQEEHFMHNVYTSVTFETCSKTNQSLLQASSQKL